MSQRMLCALVGGLLAVAAPYAEASMQCGCGQVGTPVGSLYGSPVSAPVFSGAQGVPMQGSFDYGYNSGIDYGMSGGIVIKDNEPVGVLVVQNSPADLDGDGKEDHSSDIVSLADYHMVLSNR